ncbi:DUF2252 domain-containing protein [Lichenicola sp.]|uniref:DUF2252 domain-containing protein n=1 Tax=Lichenicola sp. TaxID=2804529 RepID=UPI003B00814D
MERHPSQSNPLVPRADRYAAGRAMRRVVSRHSHADWQATAGRADPIAILEAQGRRRIAELLPIRYGRMRASPLAFLRGAAAIMAADLATTPATGLVVQSCGDCHLLNFGSYATPEGLPVFDINDFDETLPAPFEWDLKRLSASLVLAGRGHGLAARACRRLAADAVLAYASEIGRLAGLTPLEAWSTRIDLLDAIDSIGDRQARRHARLSLEQQLQSAAVQYGLLDTTGTTPRLIEKPPLVMRLPGRETEVRKAFARYAGTLSPERRLLLERYRLEDVIFKVVGIGSVGTFCAIGLFSTADGEPLLLQIKEAQASVLEPFAGPSAYGNSGERVVVGQRVMQAASDLFLGWTHSTGRQDNAEDDAHDHAGEADAGGRHFYVRRLKDSRLAALGSAIEQHGLQDYAALCGQTLGRAHARSGEIVGLSAYIGRGRAFARAIADFGVSYADQTERDFALFGHAVSSGRLPTAPG